MPDVARDTHLYSSVILAVVLRDEATYYNSGSRSRVRDRCFEGRSTDIIPVAMYMIESFSLGSPSELHCRTYMLIGPSLAKTSAVFVVL